MDALQQRAADEERSSHVTEPIMPSVDVADARGDAAADAVWTTADYLPQGSWVDVRAGSSSLGDQDLRSSSVATRKALEREAVEFEEWWRG